MLSSGPGGLVYRVRHLDLGVDRVLKVCQLRDPESIQHFSQAARIQAGLRHPNLVGVVDVIDVGGLPAMLLELVEGPTLAELLQDAPPCLADATQLFMDILAGMACAHAAGVVHRDLKPSNVVLDLTATPPAARVTDFGIAQEVGGEPELTQSLGFCGTPAWCAPELLSGDRASKAGSHFSGDVYALGALLYTLSTGRAPFPQVDLQALLQAKNAPSYVDPSVAAGQPLPAAITVTIARCLQPDPSRRPADAVAVQKMLAPTGEVLQAAPRNARAFPLTTLLACALAGSVALSIVFAAKWSKADRRARAGSLELAAAQVSSRDPAAALALLRAAAVVQGATSLDAPQAASLQAAGAMVIRLDQAGRIGVRAALSDHLLAIADDEPSVRVYDRASGALVAKTPSPSKHPTALALDPDGRWIVVSAPDDPSDSIHFGAVWSLPQGTPLATAAGSPSWARSSPTDSSLLLQVFDRADGRRSISLRVLPSGQPRWARDLAAGSSASFTGDGLGLMTTEPGEKHRVRSLTDGRVLRTWTTEAAPLYSPVGGQVATVSSEDGLRVIDESTGAPVGASRAATVWPTFSTSGRFLAAADRAGRVYALAAQSGATLPWPSHDPVRIIAPRPGGFILGTASGGLSLWDPGTSDHALTGLLDRPISASEHGGAIIASDLGGRVALWTDPLKLPGMVQQRAAAPAEARWGTSADLLYAVGSGGIVSISADGARQPLAPLAPEGRGTDAFVLDSTLFIVDGDQARSLVLPVPARGAARGIIRLPGGTVIAHPNRITMISDQGELLWSQALRQIQQVQRLDDQQFVVSHGASATLSVINQHGEIVRSAHVDSEQAIASLSAPAVQPGAAGVMWAGTYCGRLVRFEGDTGRVVLKLSSPVSAVTAGPSGHPGLIAAGTWQGEVVLVEAGAERWRARVGDQVTALAWSPEGAWLVAADGDGYLTWFNSQGQPVAVRRAHGPGRVRLRATTQGLWSMGADGVLARWETATVLASTASLEDTGKWTNLRVCRSKQQVVPVLPWPSPSSVWAPEQACGD